MTDTWHPSGTTLHIYWQVHNVDWNVYFKGWAAFRHHVNSTLFDVLNAAIEEMDKQEQ